MQRDIGEALERFVYEAHFSSIVDEFPDEKQFPKYYKAQKAEFILRPGDKLFIPTGWFHWAFSQPNDDEPNVAVNYWYDSNDWQVGDEYTAEVPRKTTFDASAIDYKQLLESLDGHVQVSKSETHGFMTGDRVMYRYPAVDFSMHTMPFDLFYKMKDRTMYMMGHKDTRLDRYAPPHHQRLIKAQWWVNWGHVTSGLHFDNWDNWLCQLSGTKRVLMFEPDDYDNLYTLNPYPVRFIKYVRDKVGHKKVDR
jgi:hypothetical protein